MKLIGKVKTFKTKNGSGFIYGEEGDVFVHVSNILENVGTPSDLLVPDEEVEYELFTSRRGMAASKVRRLNPPALVEFTGLVKKFVSNLGYGFIGSKDGDVYFHITDLLHPTVNVDDEVTYYKATIRGKHRALRVTRKTTHV